jgi:hypothetical protein
MMLYYVKLVPYNTPRIIKSKSYEHSMNIVVILIMFNSEYDLKKCVINICILIHMMIDTLLDILNSAEEN